MKKLFLLCLPFAFSFAGKANVSIPIVLTCPASITISPLGTATICQGASLNISASGGISYLWSTGETTSTINVSPSSSTFYVVTGTDSYSCTATDTVFVNVDAPSVSPTVSPSLMCQGSNATLSAGATSGTTPYTYYWSTASWLSCNTCANPVASPPSAITYSLWLTDADGCASSRSVAVNIDALSCWINATSTIPCNGSPVHLTANTTGGVYPLTYSWLPGGSHTSTDTVSRPSTSVNYTLTVTDANGCTVQAFTTVTPYSLSASLPSIMNICTNSTPGSLNPSVWGGAAPYTYLWSTGSTLASLNLTGLSTGVYSVTVTDNIGCSNSASCHVNFIKPPKILITARDNEIFARHNDTLKATGAVHYTWDVENTTHWTYWGDSSHIIISTTSSNTSYIIIANGTDSAGCMGKSEYLMTPPTKIVVSLPDTTVVYSQQNNSAGNINGLFAMVSGGHPPYTFAWSWSAGKDTTRDPWLSEAYFQQHALSGGTYSVSVIDFNGTNSTSAKGYVQVKSVSDTMIVSEIKTHRIGLYPGDSLIRFGDSTWYMNPTTFNIYSEITKHIQYTGIALGHPNTVGGTSFFTTTSIAVGSNNILNNGAMAFGWGNNSATNFSISLGTSLANTITGSIMMGGYNSMGGVPAITILPDMAHATYGFVGIGTTAPTYPLDVNGVERANEVKVCVFGTCDFVFDKDYKLMPLTDLENYLNLNHHLPGIPSAEEMKNSDGVALGKMVSQLLQKDEELTLYIIQQQKQLDEMKKELAKINKQ